MSIIQCYQNQTKPQTQDMQTWRVPQKACTSAVGPGLSNDLVMLVVKHLWNSTGNLNNNRFNRFPSWVYVQILISKNEKHIGTSCKNLKMTLWECALYHTFRIIATITTNVKHVIWPKWCYQTFPTRIEQGNPPWKFDVGQQKWWLETWVSL